MEIYLTKIKASDDRYSRQMPLFVFRIISCFFVAARIVTV